MEFKELTEKRKKWVESTKVNGFDGGINNLLTELYPDNAHFIYELLQNAEDTGATEVNFKLSKNELEFLHNGKSFNVKDGLAISTWIRMGKKAAIITGRRSKIVERRAKELGINFLFQGVHNKGEVLDDICKELDIEYANIAAIGDDLNDTKMLSKVGKSFTPADGSEHIKNICDVILYTNGGQGAVREMIESVVKDNGEEDDFLKIWK